MELARLASKQQAASSKQLALQGPFWAPEQQGPRNQKKMVPRYPGRFSATFSGTSFFLVGNGDSLGLWPVLGRGHIEKFRARAVNGKAQFPGARGTFRGKVSPRNCAATFLPFAFWPTGPQAQEIAKYGQKITTHCTIHLQGSN